MTNALEYLHKWNNWRIKAGKITLCVTKNLEKRGYFWYFCVPF